MTRPSRHSRPINGRVLYQARARLGLTPARVAALTGGAGHQIDDSYLSKLELGKIRHPRQRVFDVLTEVYKLSAEQMCAPCETCRQDWTAACIEHPAAEAAPAGQAAGSKKSAA